MNLLKTIEKLVSFLKQDPTYRIDATLSWQELSGVVAVRGVQFIRGLWKRFFFKKTEGFCFIGKYVRLEHAYKITAGSGLILEDFAHLNGLSERGFEFGRNVTIAKYACLTGTGVIARKGVLNNPRDLGGLGVGHRPLPPLSFPSDVGWIAGQQPCVAVERRHDRRRY